MYIIKEQKRLACDCTYYDILAADESDFVELIQNIDDWAMGSLVDVAHDKTIFRYLGGNEWQTYLTYGETTN